MVVQSKSKTAPKAKKRTSTVTNQVNIDAKNPIPFEHNGSAFSYINHTRYIPFLASESYNYAQSLLEARLLSTTHNACITTKKDYCAGSGFEDAKGVDLDKGIVDWFQSINLKNEPVTELNKQIFESFFTFGNTPVELVRLTVAGKRSLFVYAHNFLEWRLCIPDDNDIVTHAIQSKLFIHKHFVTAEELKKAKKLPIYNPRNRDKDNWFKDDKGVERTLIWYKHSVTGFPQYGLPSSVSSMINQILEYKASRYNLDNFDNNMVVPALLALKGSMSQGEADKIGRQLINTHTGDGKRGRTMVISSEEGIESSSFHQFDTHKDGSYTEADDKWTQKIILANQWDALLAGLIAPSTLGKGHGFLTKIIEHKEKTVIKPAQSDIIQKVWNTIFQVAQEWLSLPFDKYEMKIKSFVSFSPLSDIDITTAVQVNEVRTAVGLQEDPAKKGEYMGAAKPQQQSGGDNVQN